MMTMSLIQVQVSQTYLLMTKFIGIDPGSTGALCCLDSDTHETTFKDTPSNHGSSAGIQAWINMNAPKMIGLEKVHAIFGTSAGSNFKFGENTGIIKGVIWTCTFGIDEVTPKNWQKACGIAFKKGMTSAMKKKHVAAIAQQLYPSAALHGPRGGLLDGRSDALMIAHHMMLKYGGSQ
jgi:hypothetical protein